MRWKTRNGVGFKMWQIGRLAADNWVPWSPELFRGTKACLPSQTCVRSHYEPKMWRHRVPHDRSGSGGGSGDGRRSWILPADTDQWIARCWFIESCKFRYKPRLVTHFSETPLMPFSRVKIRTPWSPQNVGGDLGVYFSQQKLDSADPIH